MARKNQEVTAPIMPKVQDYGLEEEDLKKVTIRDILLSEGLASVVMVLGTALSIWAYSWWGIALACIGLGVLYAVRRVLNVVLKSKLDASRLNFKAALNEYYINRHLYDAELDEIERQKRLDKEYEESNQN